MTSSLLVQSLFSRKLVERDHRNVIVFRDTPDLVADSRIWYETRFDIPVDVPSEPSGAEILHHSVSRQDKSTMHLFVLSFLTDIIQRICFACACAVQFAPNVCSGVETTDLKRHIVICCASAVWEPSARTAASSSRTQGSLFGRRTPTPRGQDATLCGHIDLKRRERRLLALHV